MRSLIMRVALSAVLGVFPWALQAADLPGKEAVFLSGGVGDEEFETLRQVRADYPLRFLFVDASGGYVTGVRVTLFDDQGQVVLAKEGVGPLFFVRLPFGRYQMRAGYEGRVKELPIELPANQQREIIFRWSPD